MNGKFDQNQLHLTDYPYPHMKFRIITLLAIIASFANGCSQGKNKTSLPAMEFSKNIGQTTGAVVLDVRRPDEYKEGHLANSLNINWNSNNFEAEVLKLDKTSPMYVYCLAGSRSASAAEKMRAIGFKQVYELEGGISKWKAAKLPVTTQ